MGRRAWLALAIAAALGGPAAARAGEASPGGPIADLQARLAGLGCDPGPVDGVMTEKTRRAMLGCRPAAGRAVAAGPAADPVAAAQAALRRLGFLAAPADGAIGPQTRDAIIRFQAENHLPIDPRVSDRLLAALERAEAGPGAATAGATPATPPTPAPSPAAPEASGREALPPGVTPPPIR